ncbi:hypothetical protein C1645_823678 [Glomus cerebriforme]|uniref:F-box domain-containing protein n=1 Tax=Glomus cerebriforme TaxID=658196 RepID=A0A397T4W9_9GLOM|nr:hypothetical protein C1645_823678 [Glomus cerebriforme]
MSCLLLADYLNEIFEYLEDDKITLHSCLLVNRIYCEIAIRILWRNVWNISYYKTHILLAIMKILIACLPNESKDLLHKNGIFIITPTQKPPLFNYASFCKVLSINKIDQMIQHILENQSHYINLNYKKYLLLQEIIKMYMKQVSSLKSLCYYSSENSKYIQNPITYFIGAKNCLSDLTELNCSSNIYSEFFYQISQICYNIKSITIDFRVIISDGLTNLISLQNNLESVTLKSDYYCRTEFTISSLVKSSLTLTKLKIVNYNTSISFISKFKNLQELILSSNANDYSHEFNQLQHITFSQLRVLKFLYARPRAELLIKFLENNGKNLTEFYVGHHDISLNLAIAKFCLNLKSLFAIFVKDELEILKVILNNCQYLENIRVWCGNGYLDDKEFLNVLVKYSSKNFYELEIYYCISSEILPEDLEKFFINWKNRKSKKSLSLTIFSDNEENFSLDMKNMEIIKIYIETGLIKKFNFLPVSNLFQ